MSNAFRRYYVTNGIMVLLLLAAGCGRSVSIEGTVTFDGQPVESGTIAFEPADGQGPTIGGGIEGGRYAVTGQSGGKKVVRIRASRETGRQIETGPPAPPGTMVDEVESYIPAMYNSQSTLTCEVTGGGTSRHDFELTSK